MSETQSEPRPDGTVGAHRPVSRQVFWILPITLATIGLSVLLLKNKDWGANFAAIISVPINVAAIVVTILIDRGTFKNTVLKKPRTGSRRMRIAAFFTTATLLVSGVIWWFEKEPDPFDYLSGEVRIGYYDANYQGWHTFDQGAHVGFDVDVETAIAQHFAKARVKWINLGTLENRIAALRGPWKLSEDDTVTQPPVKLVISNFSMTPQRAELIDFAGPYFVDTQGFLSRTPATDITSIPPGKVCVLEGSSSLEKLKQIGWNPIPRASLELCLREFESHNVDAISDDRSILAGYAKKMTLSPPVTFQYGTEKYGVGLPNNMPHLCAELNKVLTDFLQYQWKASFDNTVARLGVTDYKAPQSVEDCQSAGPLLNL